MTGFALPNSALNPEREPRVSPLSAWAWHPFTLNGVMT